MREKIAIVTGASSGIGKVTALELARRGATVVLMCRNRERAERVVTEIRNTTQNERVHILLGDFSSLPQVRALAKQFSTQFDRLDILVNNAGQLPGAREITEAGFEKSFCVNYLAPFLLTQLLLDQLKQSPSARVINISSELHRVVKIPWDDLNFERRYGAYRVYSIAKLANVMFTHELARQLNQKNIHTVTVNCLHPGAIASQFGDTSHWYIRAMIKLAKPFLLSPEQGAQTTLYLATSPTVEKISGQYFKQCRPVNPSSYSTQPALCRKLWDLSLNLVQLTHPQGKEQPYATS